MNPEATHKTRALWVAGVLHAFGQGAATVQAGPMPPLNPFYLGLYGGSESAASIR